MIADGFKLGKNSLEMPVVKLVGGEFDGKDMLSILGLSDEERILLRGAMLMLVRGQELRDRVLQFMQDDGVDVPKYLKRIREELAQADQMLLTVEDVDLLQAEVE